MAKHENLPFPIGTTFFGFYTGDPQPNQPPATLSSAYGVPSTNPVEGVVSADLEGKEYEIEDLNYQGSNFTVPQNFQATKSFRTSYLKKVRVVRNATANYLNPGTLIVLENAQGNFTSSGYTGTSGLGAGGATTQTVTQPDGRFFMSRVTGYATSNAGFPNGPAFGVDEFLPASGVAPGDLFYATVEGPFQGFGSAVAADYVSLEGMTANMINVGDWVVAATASASTFGATTGTSTGHTAGRIAGLTINAGTTANSQNAVMIMNRVGRALSAVTSGQSTTVFTAGACLIYMTKL